ncbi:MAG TPA: antirestriction protein [Bacteroidetes bacterium]|nr:antirestriction protein [Bacteroidota bacterium]HRK00483.1 antirestriction protein [Ignavibacteria bacterium]
MNPKVKDVLTKVLTEFAAGTVPEKIAYIMFPFVNIPSSSWSLCNHLVMFIHDTEDARGFRQWNEVGRMVKKGSTSFKILVPCFRKEKDEQTDEDIQRLSGFTTANVFRVEDTEGETLAYERLQLPSHPLMDKAHEWGIEIKAVPGNTDHFGYYSPDKKLIALATPEESTFYHELCHVAHEKIIGKLKRKQDPLQEIVAELSAHVLCRIVGKDGSKFFGNSYRYIEGYAKEIQMSPHSAVLHIVSDVEKVLGLILDTNHLRNGRVNHERI